MLQAHDLFKCVTHQVSEIFHAIVLCREGSFFLVDQPVEDKLGHNIQLSTQSLLMDSIRKIDELAHFRKRIPHGRLYVLRKSVRRRPAGAGRGQGAGPGGRPPHGAGAGAGRPAVRVRRHQGRLPACWRAASRSSPTSRWAARRSRCPGFPRCARRPSWGFPWCVRPPPDSRGEALAVGPARHHPAAGAGPGAGRARGGARLQPHLPGDSRRGVQAGHGRASSSPRPTPRSRDRRCPRRRCWRGWPSRPTAACRTRSW